MLNPDSIKIVKELARPEILFSVARVPNSSRLFFGASDAKIYDVDIAAEKPEPEEMVGHESYVTGAAIAGERLVTGSYDGRLIWWDIDTRKQVKSTKAHNRWIRGIAVTPDGTRIVSVADDMVCRIWDAQSCEVLLELRGHAPKTPNHFPSMLYACAISADAQLIATGDRVGHVVVWEGATGKQLGTVDAPLLYTWDPKQRIHSIGGIRSLAFSPDSRLLAVGGIGQIGNIDHLGALARLEVFDWRKGERTHEFADEPHKGLIEKLQFHPQGDWLFGAGGDHKGFYKFFDLGAGKLMKQDAAPMHVHDFAFNESFDTIYAAGHGRIVVWEMSDEATGA